MTKIQKNYTGSSAILQVGQNLNPHFSPEETTYACWKYPISDPFLKLHYKKNTFKVIGGV